MKYDFDRLLINSLFLMMAKRKKTHRANERTKSIEQKRMNESHRERERQKGRESEREKNENNVHRMNVIPRAKTITC